MPKNVRIEGVGVVRFPDDMSDGDITHAIETDILGPRAQIAARNASAPQSEEEGPIRRFLQGAGLPASKDEFVGLIKTLATPGGPGPAMAGGVINMLTNEAGAEAGSAQADMAQGNYGGAAGHALAAAVPFLGHPLAEGNIAGAAGRAASIVAPELLRTPAMRSSLPEALDASAAAQNAKVVNPAGNMPALAESIGSQMAKGGMVMRNPRAELPGAFGVTERGPSIVETPVQQFRNPASAEKQLAALQEKYPDAQITTEGDKFVIREMRDPAPPQTPEQQAAMKLAPTAQKPSPILARSLSAHGAATVAGYVGHALGGPTGAAIGAGAVEAAMIAKRIMTNPLARTLQAAAKSKLASALRSGDVATLAQIGARVLNGNDLNDEYGHDQAVWDVVNSAHTEAGGDPQIARQILATKEPVYVTPAGEEIRPPYHIIQAFRNQVSGNVSNNAAGMAARDAKGGQAPAGRQAGIQGQIAHDFAGHPMSDSAPTPGHDWMGNPAPKMPTQEPSVQRTQPPAKQNPPSQPRPSSGVTDSWTEQPAVVQQPPPQSQPRQSAPAPAASRVSNVGAPQESGQIAYDPHYVRGDNNNPLNIKYGQLTNKWITAGLATLDPRPPLDGGHFLRFDNLSDGFAAAADLLRTNKYRNLPVDDAMRQWSAGAYDAAELGLPNIGTARVADLSVGALQELLMRMAHYESGFRYVGQPATERVAAATTRQPTQQASVAR